MPEILQHAGRPLCYGNLELPSRYLLSPLAGYTNLPFRMVVRELGGLGLATTDLVNARGDIAKGGPLELPPQTPLRLNEFFELELP